MGLSGDVLHGFTIVHDKRCALDQIARRISADSQFRKKYQAGALGASTGCEVDDLRGIAGEVSHRGIDLAQRDLHTLSVMGGRIRSQVGRVTARPKPGNALAALAHPEPGTVAMAPHSVRGLALLLRGVAAWEL